MKLLNLRKELKTKLEQHQIDIVDADYILSEILGVKVTELALIENIDDELLDEVNEKIEKRIAGTPVEKIFNRAYFYGYEFEVDENVLSPRADTEMLVETALKYIKQNQAKEVLDMCTGSGCVAISIKKNADVNMTAVDISMKALRIAKSNAKKLGTEITFVRSDMFEKIDGKFDVIVSNPPYIDSEEIDTLDKEVVEHDPRLALDGGAFGLKFYNIIHDNIRKHLNPNGVLVLEIGEDQKNLVVSLFNDCELLECLQDYAGNDRVLVFKR